MPDKDGSAIARAHGANNRAGDVLLITHLHTY